MYQQAQGKGRREKRIRKWESGIRK